MAPSGFFASSALSGPDAATYVESTSLLLQESYGTIVVAAVLLAACWITVGLRVYVRTVLIHGMGWDDWVMLVTLLLFSAQAALFMVCAVPMDQYAAEFAAGLTPDSAMVPNLIAAAYCLYAATMVMFKISLGFFFLRIFKSRKVFVWTLIISTIIPTVFGVVNVIYTAVVSCQIENLFFVGLTWCSDSSHASWLILAEAWTFLNMVSDVLYAILSMVAIYQLKMSIKQKVIASLLCALGCLGSLASIVRLVLFLTNTSGYSLLGEGLLQAIWTLIEPGFGITAASMATLRPLLRKDGGKTVAATRSNSHMLSAPSQQQQQPWSKVMVVGQLNTKSEYMSGSKDPHGVSTVIEGPEF